jgi:hypothetical protein
MKLHSVYGRMAVLVLFLAFMAEIRFLWRPEPASVRPPESSASSPALAALNATLSAPSIEPVNPAAASTGASKVPPISINPPETDPRFIRFADWCARYTTSTGEERLWMEAEGLELALRRRDQMLDLIEAQPARALALALPAGIREQLPVRVRERVEERR